MQNANFIVRAGKYQKRIDETLEKIKNEKIVERIWKNDFTVWGNKPDEIVNRLGWLHSPDVTGAALGEINAFVDEVRKEGFSSAIVLGMGGSSMAPEVFSLMYGRREGYLDLHVLDSTDPGAIIAFDKMLDPAKTLYIVSTKSGGTVETFSFMKHFYNQTIKKAGIENAGKHFIAITDPKSGLIDTAKELKFRKIFENDPNIGGRYSALSFFGMVPAALTGIDLRKILDNANKIINETKLNDIKNDTGAYLGAVMGTLANEGVDKVTFITPGKISYFGAWVEQLIAESTGKNGKGILPVDGEAVESPEYYSNDRLFAYIHMKDDNTYLDKVNALEKTGHPIVEIIWDDLYDLGSEYFRWEFSIPIAGRIIGIQPFDQPNVEAAKVLARKMVKEYQEKGKLPELKPSLEENGISFFGDVKAANLSEALKNFLDKSDAGKNNYDGRSYVAIQAYVKPEESTTKALLSFRTAIQRKYKLATTVGYGPRFLHSTGQLHKGDAGHGLFIQFISEMKNDLPIPDKAGNDKSSISFGTLKNAQALGDRQALLDNKRRVIRFNLGKDINRGLGLLTKALD
jgi:glucose-6-phosphate isomerase